MTALLAASIQLVLVWRARGPRAMLWVPAATVGWCLPAAQWVDGSSLGVLLLYTGIMYHWRLPALLLLLLIWGLLAGVLTAPVIGLMARERLAGLGDCERQELTSR